MKPKVLWIEDSARFELTSLVGPVYASGKYDFDLADDVTKAIRYLLTRQFDVLIFDIRLPPGIDREWRKSYERAGSDKVRAHLGLRLLEWLLGHNSKTYEHTPPKWINPEQIAVFTVESRNDLERDLTRLGISMDAYEQKTAGHPDTILLTIIERVLSKRGNNTTHG